MSVVSLQAIQRTTLRRKLRDCTHDQWRRIADVLDVIDRRIRGRQDTIQSLEHLKEQVQFMIDAEHT